MDAETLTSFWPSNKRELTRNVYNNTSVSQPPIVGR